MDDRYKQRIGDQIEPGGRTKAPGRLELLQRFVNTWNHDFPAAWDRLGTPERAGSWLAANNLVPVTARLSARDAARLRELREAIRELVRANEGSGVPDAAAVRAVRDAASNATLRVALAPSGQTTLEPEQRGVPGAIATLLGIVHEAQTTGVWSRFKGCRRCGYVFYDRSKNRSAAWCAMSICGNRTKNQAYRRRRSSGERGRPSLDGPPS